VDGFQYLRNRWYDPNVGRFTQEDPIGFGGGVNLYAYAGSNPVSYSDPYGLCPPKNTDVSDCGHDLVGLAYRVLASHGGEAAIQAIVDRNLSVGTATGGSIASQTGMEHALGFTDGSRITIAQGLTPGAAAAVMGHEVSHVVNTGTNICSGEVNATNAGLDVYDALPDGAKENPGMNGESARRSANPAAFNAATYRSAHLNYAGSPNAGHRSEASKC
jgi:uncharacterized protein RhaS with RHS repeats